MDERDRLAQIKSHSQAVFRGVRFDVQRVQVKDRAGNFHQKEYVAHPGAAIILPLLDENTLLLIRNTRFAVEEMLWELPTGTLEPKESPLETAGRELLEETGYKASKLEYLCAFYTSPGICNEVMYAYIAKDLELAEQHLDATEQIEVSKVTWKEALKMIADGTIKDGKTITTLLYKRFLDESNFSEKR